MKIKLEEYQGCFAFEFEAETMEDAVTLSRLAINKKENVKTYIYANRDKHMTGTIVFSKKRRETSSLC